VAQVLKTGRISDHLPIEITIDTDDIKDIDVALKDAPSRVPASASPEGRKKL
jgi:hypothetical protein